MSPPALVMLDRDGVLNEDRPDHVKTPDELVLIPGAVEAVARLNNAGCNVAVVTNQSGVGRRLFDESMLQRIHEKLLDALAAGGARLDAIIYCSDAPRPPGESLSSRRKPAPGMLYEAMSMFSVGPEDAVFVGDDLRDLEAAVAAGCRRVLVRTGKGAANQARGLPSEVLPVAVYANLSDAVDYLLDGS